VPKSSLFTPSEARSLPRGTTRIAVNKQHNRVAVGWLDNKAINFIFISDTMAIKSVQRCVGCEKQQVPAPEIVFNYNKYMGGIDSSDRLRATFSLGKQHKFKKYYVKLMLFLVDIALTSAWIYYQMANDQVGGKAGDRADFYICIASEMIRQDLDFEALYKVRAQGNRTLRPRQNTRNDESGTNEDDNGYDSEDDNIEDLIKRPNIQN